MVNKKVRGRRKKSLGTPKKKKERKQSLNADLAEVYISIYNIRDLGTAIALWAQYHSHTY